MLLSLEMAYQDPNLDYKAVPPVIDRYLVQEIIASSKHNRYTTMDLVTICRSSAVFIS
jgi:hypothetical protein